LIDRLEPRVQLSATLEYRPQNPDGTLDAPVTVTSGEQVQDFRPEQSSLLEQGATSANFDLFLQLTNIQGESKRVDHANQIDLLSFSWGHDASYAFSDTGYPGRQDAVPGIARDRAGVEGVPEAARRDGEGDAPRRRGALRAQARRPEGGRRVHADQA
jgi:hypothetical protein